MTQSAQTLPAGVPEPIRMLDGKVVLYAGDCRDSIRLLADNSIDAVVTDPPYALVSIQKRFGGANAKPTKDGDVYARASRGFMSKTWDTGEVAFATEFWAEVFRVLKPGGHVAAFSGTRTYHRMTVAIEDAGFEIRDQLAWVYFSGFPKSHNVGRAIDRELGAERKKVRVTNVRNPKATGGGKDGTEGATRPWIEAALERGYHEKDGDEPSTPQPAAWNSWGTALKPAWEPICLARKPLIGTVAANVLEHGAGALNIDDCRVGDEPRETTRSNGVLVSKNGSMAGGNSAIVAAGQKFGAWPANITIDGSEEVMSAFGKSAAMASRLFYSAKADANDRIGSKHPTVKPVDLMQWLCRLITPPGGTVLDPFAGSGTTGEAAWREGFRAVLCEREEEYQADIQERMRLANSGPIERRQRIASRKRVAANDNDLFGAVAGGGVAANTMDTSQSSTSAQPEGGGIMAGKGGFGFRIREQRMKSEKK